MIFKGDKITLLLLLCFLATSCRKHLSPLDYVQWVKQEKNGLHQKKQVGEYLFDVQYKPSEFIALNECKGMITDQQTFEKRRQELDNLQYFTVSLSVAGQNIDFLKYGVSNEKDFYNRQYYYSFDFQNDIKLQQGSETLPCKLFHFERSYDLSNARTFVLGFPKGQKPGEDLTLILEPRDLNTGIVKIAIDKASLQSIPNLSI